MQVTQTNASVLQILDDIYTHEVAGILRYLHYAHVIMGYSRIPVQKWLREQATESMQHSILVGDKITALGGQPPVYEPVVAEVFAHTIDGILSQALAFEERALALYRMLAVTAAALDDIALEELARAQIASEQSHVDEVRKMLRSPN